MSDSNHLLTERDIQDILKGHLDRKNRTWIIPNVYCYEWESDLLAVMKSGRTEEYEIKTSRRDFRVDELKRDKWEILQTGQRTWQPSRSDEPPQVYSATRPNYFYYVTAEGIVTLEDIPQYAGWIEIRHDGTSSILRRMKKAPLLHSEKIKDVTLRRMGRSLMFRYWDIRQVNTRLQSRIEELNDELQPEVSHDRCV